MEENHATRLNLTITNNLGEIPGNFSLFKTPNDWASSASENLTERDGITDGESITVPSLPQPTDPVFGYHIHPVMSAVAGKDVFDVSELGSISKFVSSHIEWGLEPGSFLITNLSTVVTQFHQWCKELPMVEPFYAVKCNPDPAMLRLLSSLGCGFDCATMGEIDLVLNGLGEDFNGKEKKIVYANPAKMSHMIQFAIDNEVRLTVFDGEDELRKIAGLCCGENKLDLLLRLTTHDRDSVCAFSNKFGCPVAEAPRLLALAQSLGLNVVGVCFHVGSGCRDPAAYTKALRDTVTVFEAGRALGMPDMYVVDIGGGFPGDTGGYGGPEMPTFQDLCAVIRAGLADLLVALGPARAKRMQFIAEPGRYFASAATSVATKVYARKGGSGPTQALYVDDGVYGTFNSVLYDHASPVASKVVGSKGAAEASTEEVIPTSVFGPTCDGLDQMCDYRSASLARCQVGDWLLWENMGAYTHTASFVFNGYTHVPNRLHCVL